LHPSFTEHEGGQAASAVFQGFGMTRSGLELSLPASVARARICFYNNVLFQTHGPFHRHNQATQEHKKNG